MEDFIAEYQLISDDEMLRQLTQVKILSRGEPPMPMSDYRGYQLSETAFKQNFGSLLPRNPFNKRIYALFFKVALPFNCDIRDHGNVIISPLNFTILFRLISELRTLGYPSHWLCEALTNILDNKVMTTGRPPRKLPQKVADVKRSYPVPRAKA